MIDHEKVIKEVARIREDHFGGMTSYEGEVLDAALALMKAQEPRLLTSKDFSNSPIADAGGAIPCWKESKSPTRRSGWAVIVYGRWLADTENGTSRYWTSRPTDEQREATPWPN